MSEEYCKLCQTSVKRLRDGSLVDSEQYLHSIKYQKVSISESGDPADSLTKEACVKLKLCQNLRQKWVGAHPIFPQVITVDAQAFELRVHESPSYDVLNGPLLPALNDASFKLVKGVAVIKLPKRNIETVDTNASSNFHVHSYREFVKDYYTVNLSNPCKV